MNVCHDMKLDYATYLAKDEKRIYNFEHKPPYEVCFNDQHPSLCSQTMYFNILKYDIDSDYCLYHITV